MTMTNRSPESWPRTVDEAVDWILAKLDDSQKDALREKSEKDLYLLHFGLGLFIRNTCGLWGGNADLLASCGSPNMHPDSASEVIVKAVWTRLRDE